MIPSKVPHELQNLTQTEEMLIARALPIMRAYIKPGGQRGYSGHCINLPQNDVPSEPMTVEADDDIISDGDCSPDTGPPTGNPIR